MYVKLGLRMDEFATGMKEVEKELKKVEKKFSGFKTVGDKIAGMGKTLTVGLTAPIIAASAAMTKWAMDAVESENLFEVSMGNMAGAARAWSQELSKSLGLNEYETRRNIGTFDVMLKSFGMNETAAYGMAKGLTQLAYDMASFYNIKPEEAFQKLQSGISGEIEPLRRLGITVSEVAVKTYAYTHGIAAQGAELNEQQKVLARYGLIMERTKTAQGDLARTIMSPVNQLRVLRSLVEETGIKFGQMLIPVVLKTAMALNHFAQWLNALPPGAKQTVISLALMVAVLGPLLLGIGKMIALVPSVVQGFSLIKSAVHGLGKALVWLSINPIGTILIAIAALVAAGIYVYQNWDGIKGKIIAIWNLLGASAKLVGLETVYAWKAMQLKIAEIVKKLLDFVAPVTRFLPKEWRDAFNNMREAVGDSADNIQKDMQDLVGKMDGAKGDISKAAKNVGKAFVEIKPEVKDSVQDIANTTSNSAVQIGTDIDSIINSAGDLGSAAKDTRKEWEKAIAAMDLEFKILDDNFQVATFGADKNEEANAKLSRTYKHLQSELSLVEKGIKSLTAAYSEEVRKNGESSEGAQKLKAKLSELNVTEAELKAEIKTTTEKINDNSEATRHNASVLNNLAIQSDKAAKTFGVLGEWGKKAATIFTNAWDKAYGKFETTAQLIEALAQDFARVIVDGFSQMAEERKRIAEENANDLKSAEGSWHQFYLQQKERQIQKGSEATRKKLQQADQEIAKVKEQLQNEQLTDQQKTLLEQQLTQLQQQQVQLRNQAADEYVAKLLELYQNESLTVAEREKLQEQIAQAYLDAGDNVDTAMGKATTATQNMAIETKKSQVSAKEAMKDFVLKILNQLETQILAYLAAETAKAIIASFFTLGGSLAAIPGMAMASGIGIAAIEVLKAGIRGLAEGGKISNAGAVLVGERGPELLNLPRGAQVTPLEKAGAVSNITINITGNKIANDYDINRIGDQLVRKLRLAGVYVG